MIQYAVDVVKIMSPVNTLFFYRDSALIWKEHLSSGMDLLLKGETFGSGGTPYQELWKGKMEDTIFNSLANLEGQK